MAGAVMAGAVMAIVVGVVPGPTGSARAGAASPPPAPGPVLRTAPDGAVVLQPTEAGSLDERVVTIDPGHNGRNWSDPSYIDRPVWNGREDEACDTTGTSSDAGYPEAAFNWTEANLVATYLRREGATVVLTRPNNSGVGPCITVRAAIGNQVRSDAALSIHADGGPPSGRGFTILEPVADATNRAVVPASDRLGVDLRNAVIGSGAEPVSDYGGSNGLEPRDDLGGTNLTTVPKVFIECANMRYGPDAARLTSAAWRDRMARAITVGITTFLETRKPVR
jgi:N-acetylmuramoyl-L-alanine amidase